MFKNNFQKKKYYSVNPTAKTGEHYTEVPGQTVCPSCSAHIAEIDLITGYKVCPECKYHYPITAWERINLLADEDSFAEFDHKLKSYNPLSFPGYEEKLEDAIQKSGLNEAIITGKAVIGGYNAVLGVMDSRFTMGSMGSVVGEKICRAVEYAIETRAPLVLCTASGGARIQEGMLALMQMAKTSAALERFHKAGLLYICIMTHPTTGGVAASFASLADIIIAEPKSLIGFTGPRVIKQTIGQNLPQDFQRAEFLVEHGMIDMVRERSEIKDTLCLLLRLHQGGSNG